MNKFITNGLLLLLISAFIAPVAVAEVSQEANTRVEKQEELTETDSHSASETLDSDSEMLQKTETNSLPASETLESDMETIESEEDGNTRVEQSLEEYNNN